MYLTISHKGSENLQSCGPQHPRWKLGLDWNFENVRLCPPSVFPHHHMPCSKLNPNSPDMEETLEGFAKKKNVKKKIWL